ncbi:MAG: ABC transporter ATP-binding protein [Firmicutes bacterium]|nr:ABC transporter ATP-binding protein [Bacillota bacterium]
MGKTAGFPADPAVDVAGLGVRYGKLWAIRDVTVRMRRGSILGLVGPDGAGKTSLLRALCALLPPAAGSGTVLGLDLARQREQIRRRVGYIPQHFSLYGDLSVEQNLRFFARIFGLDAGESEARSRWLLRFAGLEPFRAREVQWLSGGMKQKLSLACGLIHRPELLILDEPTNGVDPVARVELWQLLQEVCRQGTAVVVSTPYLDECAYMNEVGVLVQGRLLAQGTPEQLVALACGLAWAELGVADARGRVEVLQYLRGLPGVRRAVARGERVIVALDPAVAFAGQATGEGRPAGGMDVGRNGAAVPVAAAAWLVRQLRAAGMAALGQPIPHPPDMDDAFWWLGAQALAADNPGPGRSSSPFTVPAEDGGPARRAGSSRPGPGPGPEPGQQPGRTRAGSGAEPVVAVEVQGLTKHFGTFQALAGVDLQIRQGQIFGLLGPNGAGKTTLIRILCGLMAPTAGQVRVLGREMPRQAYEVRPRIGYMSQRFSLYQDVSVRENLRFYGRVYGMAGDALVQAVDQALADFGLEAVQDRPVAEIGAGRRQRLGFACATLHRPQLLFLDEPTSGADPAARARFWEFLYELAARGTTIVVTTHYMDEAEHCDRLALMSCGRLVAVGTPADLKKAWGKASLMEVFLAVARKTGAGPHAGQRAEGVGGAGGTA